jgi:UDP-glucose 4-epimerase
MRVVVTGGSGRAGEYIIAEMAAHGWEVINADRNPPGPIAGGGDEAKNERGPSTSSGRADRGAQDAQTEWQSPALFWQVDVTDFGDVVNAVAGADAVIHMAAIPAPNHMPENQLFRINMLSSWNVLEACEVHGVKRVVMASSVNALGAGWGEHTYPPLYFPVDESHPTRVEDAYSQSKWLGEQMAQAFIRRGHIKQVANMRFHGLWDPATAVAHRERGDKKETSGRRGMGLWSWTGRHDAARACRLAIENDFEGAEAFFINASDTVLDIPTVDAIRKEYPGVPLRKPIEGFGSALDISKAKRILGWEPVESWRDGTVRPPEPVKGVRSPEYRAPWRR